MNLQSLIDLCLPSSRSAAACTVVLLLQLAGCGQPDLEKGPQGAVVQQAATLVQYQPVQSQAVWTAQGPFSSGNLYYLNNHFSPQKNPILGQINAFSDGRLGGAVEFNASTGAVVRKFNNTGADGAKSMVYLNGYYFVTGDDRQGVRRVNADFSNPTPYRGGTAESITTDGTFLYTNDDDNRGVVHKYAVVNGTSDFTLQEVGAWNAGGRVRGLSYFDWNDGSSGAIHISAGGEVGAPRWVYYQPINQFPLPQSSYPPLGEPVTPGLAVPGTSPVYQVMPDRAVGTQQLLYIATAGGIYVWQYTAPNQVSTNAPLVTLAGGNAQPGEITLLDQSGVPIAVDASLGAFFGLASDATKLYVVHGDRISAFLKIRVNAAPLLSSISLSGFAADGYRIGAGVIASDDLGEANLKYNWSLVSAPSGGSVTFTANASNVAKSTTVAFSKLGTYVLQAIATDSEGLSSAPSTVTVVVNQKLTKVRVSPPTASLAPGSTKAFSASGEDQFGGPMALGAINWSIDAGGSGTISVVGTFTASNSDGLVVVRASSGGVSGTATVTVTRDGTPYGGTPVVIGPIGSTRIEAEAYNEGGEGFAYHDTSVANEAVANGAPNFRAQESVDVWGGPPGGVLGWFNDMEWLKYTVNVTQAGFYSVTVRTASISTGSVLISALGTTLSIATPNTGSWSTYTTTKAGGLVWLTSGINVVRVEKPVNGGWLNLDYMELAWMSSRY